MSTGGSRSLLNFVVFLAAVAPAPFAVAAKDAPPVTVPISSETRGDIYMARKMYREAIDTYREIPGDSAVIANKIGIAYHQLMQFSLARKNYQRAIKLNPKYPEAINNLGTIYYAAKSYRRSIEYYKRALRLDPGSAAIEINLGSAYFGRKDYERAAECYELALRLDPDAFEHHSQYGTMLQERNPEERAKFHLYLAKTYAKRGENERAISYLRKAMEEGVPGRDKIAGMPEFAALRGDTSFQELIAANPKPL